MQFRCKKCGAIGTLQFDEEEQALVVQCLCGARTYIALKYGDRWENIQGQMPDAIWPPVTFPRMGTKRYQCLCALMRIKKGRTVDVAKLLGQQGGNCSACLLSLEQYGVVCSELYTPEDTRIKVWTPSAAVLEHGADVYGSEQWYLEDKK